MGEKTKLNNIVLWGGKNDDKSQSPTRWLHDYILFASKEVKLSVLDDPGALIPYIFDADHDDIESHELYDGVYEYKTSDLVVELVEGFQYAEYKLYGADIDYEAITHRLKQAGVTLQKPEIPVDIPGRPKLVDLNKLNKQRFDYHEETHDRDVSLAKSMTIKAAFKTVIGFVVFIGLSTFLGIQIFIPKFQDVTPLPEDTLITTKGNYLVYNINNRMTVFKFADLVDDIGYDPSYMIFVPEQAAVTDKIVVSRMTDADGNRVYDIGNRTVDFETDPTDYNFVNGKTFEFNTYRSGGEDDWSTYGELSQGRADRIVLQGRVVEREGRYMMLLGTVWAVLGDITEDGTRFYDLLGDDMSYAAVIYSLKGRKIINVYGQIERTYSTREGRNSVDKVVFSFKADYARKR